VRYNDTVKVLITGAEGALGTDLTKILRNNNVNVISTDIHQLDVSDFRKTNDMLLTHRPDVIVHCAANSDVDACEKDKNHAFRVNSLSTFGLAVIANKIQAKMVYISTNFVFDGTHECPYNEYDPPHPINEYGRTKLLGEYYVKDICNRYFIVRTSWLFGLNTKTFIPKFLVSQDKPQLIDVICDQFGSFTYTLDLADALFVLLKSENYGIYHITNKGVGSWMDYALKAKDVMKFKTEIRAITTDELDLPAQRPRYSPLASQHYEFFFNKSLRSWEDALQAFIKSLTKD
jgi:dTDP-4-dehydrorhamnose reductase